MTSSFETTEEIQKARRDATLRVMMRVLGFVLTVWATFLLTRDFVLSGETSLWFVGTAGSLGMLSFISSWWPNQDGMPNPHPEEPGLYLPHARSSTS